MKHIKNRIESIFVWFVIGLLFRQTNRYAFLGLVKALVGIQEAGFWSTSGLHGLNQRQTRQIVRAANRMVERVKAMKNQSTFSLGDWKTHWQLELAAHIADIYACNHELQDEEAYAYFKQYENTQATDLYALEDKAFIRKVGIFLDDYANNHEGVDKVVESMAG